MDLDLALPLLNKGSFIQKLGPGGGAPPVQNGFFGTKLTNGGGNWGTQADRAMLDRFALADTATIKRLFIYILAANTGEANVKGLIYTDNAGVPGTLVAIGSAVNTLGASNSYIQSNFADQVLAPGNYWLGAVSDNSGREFGSGANTSPNAVILNGTLSYANPQSTAPAPDANYANDVAVYVEYTY